MQCAKTDPANYRGRTARACRYGAESVGLRSRVTNKLKALLLLAACVVLAVLDIYACAAPVPATPSLCGQRGITRYGTIGNDRILDTNRADVMHGLGGNDVIYGAKGADIICGGSGDDPVRGSSPTT
jgi:hypothetical protein